MIISTEDDPIRLFSDKETQIITRNLIELTQSLNEFDCSSLIYELGLICDWHMSLFKDVRDHGGKIRTSEYGEEKLDFGPNKSVHRKEVPNKLEEHFEEARSLFARLDNYEKNITFPKEIVKVASYLHVKLIAIHPFRDGNGRIARLVMKYVLRRYNLPPLPITIPRHEYLAALNHYYKTKNIDPLVSLFLRIYYNQFLG